MQRLTEAIHEQKHAKVQAQTHEHVPRAHPRCIERLNKQERANEADKSMQRLENREALADKAEAVTKMTVTAWDCTQASSREQDYCGVSSYAWMSSFGSEMPDFLVWYGAGSSCFAADRDKRPRVVEMKSLLFDSWSYRGVRLLNEKECIGKHRHLCPP